MNCPNDGTNLVMSERSGIEIDYCPQCRGVWLDRGELDKIIERSSSVAPAPNNQSYNQPPQQYNQPKHHEEKYDNKHYDHGHKKHKKESFLGDLFDF
jgi:hypothetical protein